MIVPRTIVMGHPHLNPNALQAASALASRKLLREFHTSLDLSRVAALTGSSALARRALPVELQPIAKSHPYVECARLLRRALRWERQGVYAPDATAHSVDRAVARSLKASDSAVFAYEDSALKSFRRATQLNIRRIYDLPIGYWRAAEEIFTAEIALNPTWAGTLIGPTIRNQASRVARKDEELKLATDVLVASSFTKSTLALAPEAIEKVSVIPYGAPTPHTPAHSGQSGRKLRVLFVGALSQRKGISYLFDGVQPLQQHIELTLVGRPVGDATPTRRAVTAAGAKWIPSLPHSEVLEMMRHHDVLVFPSLFEGFGLVLTEALSRGLPVIATPHTAAPDLIQDGQQGWVVPVRSAHAIRERLEDLLHDRSLLPSMREASIAWARAHQWDRYRAAIASLGAQE